MIRRTALALVLALAAIAAGASAAPPVPQSAAEAERGNGVMGGFAGAGGDRALGETLYNARCSGCHDNPQGRTPPKATIAANTRTVIASAMMEGVMRPMVVGLRAHDVASIATYLSVAKDTGLGVAALEAPRCTRKPPPMTLNAPAWNGWGNSEAQSRYQPKPGFTAAAVPHLKLKWAIAYSGSRNGQASVVGGRAFLTSSSGAVYALEATTGCAYWRFDVPGGSRSSITVGRMPDGRLAAYLTGWTDRTAYALDADTGALIWKTQVDNQQEVQMTGSPVLHDGMLYIPVSSAEEAIAVDDSYSCCHFRGAVVAVNAATGKVAWETFMAAPPQPTRKNAKGVQMYGPAGGAIWAAPTIDAKRGVLYVATGDSYTDVAMERSDAVVALDLKIGAVRWSRQFTEGDNYIIGCNPVKAPANCPKPAGPDHDFGVSPVLHTLADGKQLILVGQKSSQIYALDPDAEGKVVWEHRLSPGGALGGVEFGPASDPDNYYVPISDVFSPKPAPGLYAFRISDGAPVWSAPTPKLPCGWAGPFCSPAISQAVTATPGIVFGGSMDGRFRAWDSRTGKAIWQFDTTSPVTTVSGGTARGGVIDGAGPTVAGGMVYVSSGYQARSGTPGMVLMAFSVDGK